MRTVPKYNRRAAYSWYLETHFWCAKRNEAMARANWVCQRCRKQWATEVHHLSYQRLFNEPPADLLPVCRACHRAIHYKKPANDNNPPGQLSLPFPVDDNE